MEELPKSKKEDSMKQSTLEQEEKSVSRFVDSDRILQQLNFRWSYSFGIELWMDHIEFETVFGSFISLPSILWNIRSP